MFDKNSISLKYIQVCICSGSKFLGITTPGCMQSIAPKIALYFCRLKIICSSQADPALSEFSSFYHANLRERKTSFESFEKEHNFLDDFYV